MHRLTNLIRVARQVIHACSHVSSSEALGRQLTDDYNDNNDDDNFCCCVPYRSLCSRIITTSCSSLSSCPAA